MKRYKTDITSDFLHKGFLNVLTNAYLVTAYLTSEAVGKCSSIRARKPSKEAGSTWQVPTVLHITIAYATYTSSGNFLRVRARNLIGKQRALVYCLLLTMVHKC